MRQLFRPRTWNMVRTSLREKPARRRSRRFQLYLETLETRLAPANVDVLSFHNDTLISGQNLQETTLTPANVNATSFGRLASQAVDGYVYAQPLYKANLTIPGKGTHNVAFVATQHDSVYAFDADTLSLLWQRSFIEPANGIAPVPNGDVGSGDVVPEIGITGAPVIDAASSTIYFVTKSKETRTDGVHYVQRLHALDITTGGDKYIINADPVLSGYVIGDSKSGEGYANQTSAIHMAGGGADSSGGDLKFDALREAQRPSLQLMGGRVYVAWASHGDVGSYHGWVVGFNETTLQPEKIWNASPNARGSGIWQSEGAISTDGTYLYLALGNGFNGPDNAFDPAHGDYSEAVVKLDPTGTGTAITVKDYFVPYDWQTLDNQDADLGSGGVMLLPDSVGGGKQLLVETGKSGKIYLIDRNNMGQFTSGGPDKVVQVVTAGQQGVWGNPAFYQESSTSGIIYYHGQGDVTKAYRISNGVITPTTPAYTSTFFSGFPGAQPSISANGMNNATAIDWEIQVDNYGQQGPATLRAFAARPAAQTGTLNELYNSSQTGQRDAFGGSVKFTDPVITNGHVYVGAEYEFSLFGLFPSSSAIPPVPTNLSATGVSNTQIKLTWTNPTPGANNAPTGIKVFRSAGDDMHYGTVPLTTVPRDATTFTDSGLDPAQVYFYKLVATNQTGDSTASAEAQGNPTVAPPVLQVSNASARSVTLAWTRPQVANDHYNVERSTNNFQTFVTIANNLPGTQTTYTDATVSSGAYQYRIRAFTNSAGTNFAMSNVVQARVGAGSAVIDYSQPNSFPAGPADLQANGDGQFAEGTARLVHQNTVAGSVFSLGQENILNWTTQFTVRLHEGTQPRYADGFAFVIQAESPYALGAGQGGLGYQGISNSVAVKFDTFQNTAQGETSGNSTGLYSGGAFPGGAANGTTIFDLDPAKVNLQSQSSKVISLSYAYNAANPAASVLHESVTDPDHPSTPFTHDFTVDIPSLLGDPLAGNTTAYVGFTAATGDSAWWEISDITSWRFAPTGAAAPHALTATPGGNAIDLAWKNTSADEAGFAIYRATSANGTYTQIGTVQAGVNTYHDANLAPGNYFYRVTATNADNSSSGFSNTTFTSVGVNRISVAHGDGFTNPTDLQANGTATFPGAGQNAAGVFTAQQDIGVAGDPSQPGSATQANGTYTIKASGSDIWSDTDHFHYVYRPLDGDGDIVARITSLNQTDAWAKAGVMIRASTDPHSAQVSMDFSAANGSSLQWRDSQGAQSGSIDQGAGTAPYPGWVRLVRIGNTFTAYWAPDNNGTPGNWNPAGTHMTVMGTNVLVGLGVTAHNNSALTTAIIDHVTVRPLSPVSLQLTDGGGSEAASAYTTMKLPTSLFNTSFILQDNPATGAADGVSFVLQNDPRGPSALGTAGGAEGYAGVMNSLAIKFDLYTHGSHVPSTGLFMGGQDPSSDSTKDIPLAPYGLNLGSGDPIQVNLSYNGVSLIESLTDTVTGASFTHSYAINLAQVLGGPVAYAGFSGGTGGETATQAILSWTGDFYAPPTATAAFTAAGFPATTKTGVPGSITVTAKTAAGAPDSSYRGTIHFTSNDSAAVLPADYTFTAADNGVHTFMSVVLNTAGTDSISVVDVANPLLVGTQGNILVTAAAPTAALALSFPTTLNQGSLGALTVTAKDVYGNTATGYRGTIHFSSTDQGAGLPADYTFTAADQGVHTFLVSLATLGVQRLAALDRDDPAINSVVNVEVVPLNYVDFSNTGSLQANGSAKFSPNQTAVGLFKGSQDVGTPGNPSPAGSATFANGIYTLKGSGSDVWDNNDHFQYAYELLTGDGDFIARMVSFDNPDYWSKAGLMIRSDLTTGAQDAFMLETGPNQGVHNEPVFQWRTTEFGSTSDSGNHNGPIQGAPIWLRLVRQGNSFSGYWSKDLGGGQHGPWMQMGTTQTIAMPATVYIGLADNAHNNGAVATAAFDNVSITGNTSVPLPAVAAELTDGWTGEGGSIFTRATLPVANFTTSFTLHNTPTMGAADGLTFTIQNDPRGAAALGDGGGALGYGKGDGTTNPPAIVKSVAIEFNLYSNGTHNSTTKLLMNGQVDGNNLIDMGPSGIDLKNGHPLLVTLTYDGSNLVETVKDTVTNATFTHTYQVNIVSTIGGTSAHLGFTGGTGGEAVVQDIVNWSGRFLAAPQAVQFTAAGPASATAGTSFPLTVKAADIFGNTFPGYTGMVHFTSSDPQALLPADYTFTTADNGVHTFMVTLKTAGSQTVTVTDPTGPSTFTGSATVTVNPAAASTLTVGAFPSPTTAGVAGMVTVTAKDAYGNIATGYTGMVHLTSTDTQATLPADYAFTAADHGVHTFSATLKTAGSQALTTTDTATAGITGTQSGIVVNSAAAASFVVSGFPSPTTAGVAGMVTVTAKDAFGNVAVGYTGTVHVTSSDPQAVLPANYTYTAADHGTHTFTVTQKTAGSQSLTATDTVTASITGSQTGIAVTAVAASQLTLAGFPSPVTAGVAGMFTVTAQDAFGNVATGYAGAVVFAGSDAQAALPGLYRFRPADAGVHTFSATLKTAGTQSLTVSDGTLSAMQTGIVVTPAAAASLVVNGFPSPSTAGVAGMVTVTAQDAYGNIAVGYTGTVHFTSSDAQAALPPDYAFTAADHGVHTFSATLKTAGTQSLMATDTATITGTQSGIVVNAAAADHFTITAPPSATAGVPFAVMVMARDPYGNIATGFRGTVHFASSDGQATLPADYTFTAADQGSRTFTVVLFTAGSQSLTLTSGSLTGTVMVAVAPAAASTLVVSGFPSPTTAGSSGMVTVTALDPYGNVAVGYGGTVHFTSSDSQAMLPPDYAFQPGDQGSHTFSATLATAGSQSLTATDTSRRHLTGTQSGIVVNPGPTSVLLIGGFPSPTTAGTPGAVQVVAEDAFGNITPGYQGTAHLTSSDAQARLEGDHTFTAADNGRYAFGVVLITAGTQSLTATDTGNSSLTATQDGVVVDAGTATTFAVAGFPNPVAAGTPGTITVTALDGYGNVATGYTGTVHLTSSDPQAYLDPDYTFTPDDAGMAVFNAVLYTAGTQSITATDVADASLTGTQDGIQVVPGPVSQFPVVAPAGTVAGVPFGLTVYAEDASGNIVPDYTGTVHFTSTDAHAVLPADYTFTADDAGVHTFTVALATAGDQTITVTDADGNTGSATVTVTPAAATSFYVIAPATVPHDTPFTVTIMALDPYGNVDTNYQGTVTWASSDPNAIIDPNPYTFTPDDAGVASFTVTLHLIGFQNITVTDQAGVTGSATISVTLGANGPGAAGRGWVGQVPTHDRAGDAAAPATPSRDNARQVLAAADEEVREMARDSWTLARVALQAPLDVLDVVLKELVTDVF